MANDKDFKVKNGVQPTRYVEGLGTVVASTEGYNFSGASYDSVSFSVSGQDADPYGLFFRSDGAKMYVAGDAGNDINEYNLSTPWTVSSASYSQNFSVASQESAPNGVFFKTDGTKMFIVGNTGNNVYEYALSSAWVVSSASYTRSFSVASQTTGPQGLFFSSDGLNMVVAGGANVNKYVLSSAFDISSASYSQAFTVSSQEGDPQALFFKSDGTKMYVLGSSSDTVYQYSTAKAIDTLDLSTGSVFNYSPTASKTLKLSNPAASGTNSGATLLYNSTDLAGVADKFSTTLYTGNAGTQTITNGLNLAGDGGLVWTKSRTNSAHHELTDTVRGGGSNGNALRSNGTDTEGAGDLESFTSSGFVMGYNTADGNAAQNYVSWAWKKTPNFFDIVAYTGDGNAGKTISHNLGSVPGMMIIKERNGGRNWAVYHRSLGATKYVYLNTTDAEATHTSIWNDTAPTNSVFSVGTANNTNRNGGTYIAYLFGHNTSSGPIQCGSYTGTGGSGRSVTLGWQPQWVMIKRATGGTANWHVWDSERGIVAGGNDKLLFPDSSSGENTTLNRLDVSSTGFEIPSGNNITVDGSGDTYIYMAIAAEEGASTTYDSSIKWSGGTAPTSPAIGETDVITLDTTDGGTTYRAAHAIDGAK